MQTCNIDVTKIDKSAIHVGTKGKYINITLLENRDGETDKYGNDGFVVQDIGKVRREAGEKGPIIGNWRIVGKVAPKAAAPTAVADPASDEDDDMPF